jgi:phosphohistidine phosphatase
MAKLVAHLVSGDENRPVTAFQPGSIVCLEREDGSEWRINWMIRPELLYKIPLSSP